MIVYVLTPLAKADIFDIWLYIANDSEDAADGVKRAIYELARLLPTFHARPFPTRLHNPFASFLDADALSQLRRCVPPRDDSARDRCRYAWKEKISGAF